MKKRVLSPFIFFVFSLIALLFVVEYFSNDSQEVLLSSESDDSSGELGEILENNQDLQYTELINNDPFLERMNSEEFNNEEDENKIPESVPNQYLIQFRQEFTDEGINQFYSENRLEEIRRVVNREDVKISLVDIEDESVVEAIRESPLVEVIEPNYIATPSARSLPFKSAPVPDPMISAQWGINTTRLLSAWLRTRGHPSIVIAIIDTGIRWSHPDLSANMWVNAREIPNNNLDDDNNGFVDDVRGWDFVNITNTGINCWSGEDCYQPDNNPDDFLGHGTHVAGIAGAVTDNGVGITGTCPDCKIMALRAGFAANFGASYPNGVLTYDAIISSIYYATDNGASVISMSFGGPYSQLEENAINYASNRNVILVGAAGNNNWLDHPYPAYYDNVISVTATDQINNKASFSNFGYWFDVAAPGVDILSTTIPNNPTGFLCEDLDGDGYGNCSGTSMSTPLVSGIMGLLRAVNPSITVDEIKTLIHSTTNPYNGMRYLGPGIIDAQRIVNLQTPPVAKLDGTINHQYFSSGAIQINGSVYGNNFLKYNLQVGKIIDRNAVNLFPTNWTALINDNFTQGNFTYSFNPQNYNLEVGNYLVKLNVYDTSNQVFIDYVGFSIDYSQVSGWPKYLYKVVATSAKLYDINNDGKDEIIFPASEQVYNYYVMDEFFNPLSGWPINYSTPAMTSWSANRVTPAVDDLDNDNIDEIVFKWESNQYPVGSNSWIEYLVFEPNGIAQLGFPIVINDRSTMWHSTNLAIANIDGGIDKEIVTINEGSSNSNYCDPNMSVGVYKSDGQVVPGWPQHICFSYGPVAVGDIDNDGFIELVVSTDNPLTISVFNHNGTLRQGWPQNLNGVSGAPNPPVIGDFLRNGEMQIFFRGKFFNPNGTIVSQTALYRQIYWNSANAVGDIDNDGFLDVVFGDGNCLRVLNRNASDLIGWPVCFPNVRGGLTDPIIVDLDGDGNKEIIFGIVQENQIYALKSDGANFPGFPKPTINPLPLHGSSAGDVNGDGFIDLYYGGGGIYGFYLWSFSGQANSTNLVWPQFQKDAQNTGRY